MVKSSSFVCNHQVWRQLIRIRGGAIVYRIALYEPDFVTHVFSVCTPYWPPSKQYLSLEQIIAKIPFFGYQAQLANGGLEDIIQSKEEIRQFLNAMYGGRTTDGKPAISMEKGVLLEKLPGVQPTPLLSDEVSIPRFPPQKVFFKI